MNRKPRTLNHHQASTASLTSRFPRRPILLTITLEDRSIRLAISALRIALDSELHPLSDLQAGRARFLIEDLSYALLPAGEKRPSHS